MDDAEQRDLARAEGFGISRTEDGLLVRDKPTPTVKYLKRFIKPGLTLLKFGSSGQPHERVFRLAGDLSTITYQGGWLSKLGRMIVIQTNKITRITKGQTTHAFQRMKKYYGYAANTSLTLEYRDERGRERTLNLMAANPEVFEYVVNCIGQVLKKQADKKAEQSLDSQYVEALWMRADKDKSGTLDKREIVGLIASMNVNMPRKTIETMFDKVDEDKSGDLAYDEFLRFVEMLRERKELKFFFSLVARGEVVGTKVKHVLIEDGHESSDDDVRTLTLSVEQFQKFWLTTQGQDLTPAMVIKVFEIANPDLRARRKALTAASTSSSASNTAAAAAAAAAASPNSSNFRISYQMFSNVITMADNDLFDLAKQPVYQDMTRPLSYYYIASSHNTYLEGDQLTSKASVKRYIDDLKNGCRCVELDVWDGAKEEPIITHGHTLTGSVLFKDVIQAVYDHGFENNPFPIILSIEQHCSLAQQKVQAKILRKVLGSRLALPMKDASPTQPLPSPLELRGKVLLKGKRISRGLAHEFSAGAATSTGGAVVDDDGSFDPYLGEEPRERQIEDKAKTGDVAQELSDITYLATGKVKDFKHPLPSDVIASYSESATRKLAGNQNQLENWIKLNANHLSRVFPKGTRVDSSNYNPAVGWSAGCQCVALNYQTDDEALHVNKGKFRENGGVGYVLKPESMINPVGEMSPKIRLSINIISASQLPKPRGVEGGEIIDPFVKIKIWGEAADVKEYATATVTNNGFNPCWNKVLQLFGSFLWSPGTGLPACLQLLSLTLSLPSSPLPSSPLPSPNRSILSTSNRPTRPSCPSRSWTRMSATPSLSPFRRSLSPASARA